MGGTDSRPCSGRHHPVKSVAVIGPTGQLGSDLVKGFAAADWTVIPAAHSALAVEDFRSVTEFLTAESVDVVINTAAVHQVAVCEQDVARTWAVNAGGARNVAEAAKKVGAVSVFVSTDYVFDGQINSTTSYAEDAAVSPINAYGASKAAGEIATLATSPENLVVRISSVFGSAGSSGKGDNFVETIVKKARAGEALSVVDDVYMSPSYTVDVASKLRTLLEAGATGIFHACNEGRITWHQFAEEICDQVGVKVSVARTTTDVHSIPRRPRNSSLSATRLDGLGVAQRSWRAALAAYLREKRHIS